MSLALILGAQSLAEEEAPLTNEDIVRLSETGFADAVIGAKIAGATANFDTSVDALVALKDAGVSDGVVTAMITASTTTPTGDASKPNPAEQRAPPSAAMTLPEVGALTQTWMAALLAVNTAASTATTDPRPRVISDKVSEMVDQADVLVKHPSPRSECNDFARELRALFASAEASYRNAAMAVGQRRADHMNDGSEAVVGAGEKLQQIAAKLCPLPQSVVDQLGNG